MDGLHRPGGPGATAPGIGVGPGQQAGDAQATQTQPATRSVGQKIGDFFKSVGNFFKGLFTRTAAPTAPETQSISGSEFKAALDKSKTAVLADKNVKNLNSPDAEVRAAAINTLFRSSLDDATKAANAMTKPFMAGMGDKAAKAMEAVLARHAPPGSKDGPNLELDRAKPNGPKNDQEAAARVAILQEARNAMMEVALGEAGADHSTGLVSDMPGGACAAIRGLQDAVLATMTNATPQEKADVAKKIAANAMLTGFTPEIALRGNELSQAGKPQLGKALTALSVLAQCEFNQMAPKDNNASMAPLRAVFDRGRAGVAEFLGNVSTHGAGVLATAGQFTTAPVGSVGADAWVRSTDTVEALATAALDRQNAPPANSFDAVRSELFRLMRNDTQTAFRASPEFAALDPQPATFQAILDAPKGSPTANAYDAFCKARFITENLDAYRAIDAFRADPTRSGADHIWNTFIVPGTQQQVNIAATMVNELRAALT